MSSAKKNTTKTQNKKEKLRREYQDVMISPQTAINLPGKNSVYVYSSNYQTIEKLISKYGKGLNLTESEYDDERKSIWHNLKSKVDKVDETVPFSGLFTLNGKGQFGRGKRFLNKKKKHQMRLRRKKKFVNKENYV